LDIVAKSLYTDHEVFLRELLSNASDALEKQRFANPSASDTLTVNVSVNETKKQIIIEDNGVGMTKDELINNLGTIARSGSREFVEKIQKGEAANNTAENIIGQFGVGFYSSFIVSDYVEVVSKTEKSDKAYVWSSDGSGVYEIGDTAHPGFDRGTRIILHLKPDCEKFCNLKEVQTIIQKYSNFINYPITVNGEKLNLVKAIWSRDKR
jgi:TNF receptor-associated protein 1